MTFLDWIFGRATIGQLQGQVKDLAAERDMWRDRALELADKCQGLATIEPPVVFRELCPSVDIAPLIINALGIEFINQGRAKILSGRYQLTTIDEVLRFGDWAKVHKLNYVNPFHVCNDFAAGFVGAILNEPDWWGIPCGMIIGMQGPLAGHDVVIMCACESEAHQTPQLYVIEPQNNTLIQGALAPGWIDTIWMP